MISCKCRIPNCKTGIWFEKRRMGVQFTCETSSDFVYLDANSVVEMIQQLREMLLDMADKERENDA